MMQRLTTTFSLSLLIAVLLTGCMQQLIRKDADAKLRAGDYEAALQALQLGVKDYPDSALLRAGLTTAKAEAQSQLVSQAAQLRSAKLVDQAEEVLKRALTIDPNSGRIINLLAELSADRRVIKNTATVQALLDAGKLKEALQVVDAALRDTPRQPTLVALQAGIERELRAQADFDGRRTLREKRPITLDFRQAPLSTVLEAVTRGSGVNFILDRDVRQDSRVTVFLRAVSVEDAIDLIANSHQLARRIIDTETVLIYPNTQEKHREHQEQLIRVFHLANADAKATASLLRTILRIKEPFVDDRANMIVLREPTEIITLAEKLVALHDVPDAEVMLEVEILEIKSTRLTELGINYPSSFSLTPLGASGSSSALTLRDLRDLNSSRVGVGVPSLLINLRREVGDVNILANPRIRAKNREKARVLIGDKVPVITSTATATGFVSENVSYLDVGLKLDVEPIVNPDDDVAIKLGLEVSSIANAVRTATGTLAYQIGTRNASTVLRLRDGETQLLAGLISNEDRTNANRVPGLGDLPLAGRLFSSQKDDFQRTELVLAITPRILRSAPRPALSQAEMWIGSEQFTRLRSPPSRNVVSAAASAVVAAHNEARPSGPRAQEPPPAAETMQAAPQEAASQPVRVTWKAPAEVKAGETFTIALVVESAAALRGVPVELSFAPGMVEIVDIVEGSFLRQGGVTTSFTHAVDTSNGRASAGILRNNASGSTGSGELLQLRLRAKSVGPFELTIASIRAISLGGQVSVDPLPVLKLTAK
jgi:general secretion pathway protein D